MEIFCTPYTNDVEGYIEQNLNINNMTLHLVPTMILYRKRVRLYKKILGARNVNFPRIFNEKKTTEILTNNNIYLFEFNKFLEYLVVNSQLPVLTKKESLIILERVMGENNATNNLAWKNTLSEIYNTFLTISSANLDLDLLKTFDSNQSWLELIHLYSLYSAELNKIGFLDPGMAAHKIFNEQLHLKYNFNSIFIDGAFLPIPPLLHKIILKSHNQQRQIKFFIPFDHNHPENPAFRVLKKTYEPYVPFSEWQSIVRSYTHKDHNVVEKLARNIFTENTIQVDDMSLQIVEFDTLEEEMGAIVHNAASLINARLVNHQKVAVVTPKAMEMRPIVREYAELYGINFDVPERPLVDLPFGKLVYLLCKIFVDERIEAFNRADHYIDCEVISELLYLPVFNHSQDIYSIFEQLKGFFEDCTTFADWHHQMECLKDAKDNITSKYRYHPLFYIRSDQLQCLHNFIHNIEELARKVFSHNKNTFKNHVSHIIYSIKENKNVVNLSSETEQRLTIILNSMDFHENIEVDIKEVADDIHSLFTDDEETFSESEEQLDQQQVTVTGPNNIEFQEYDYIYLSRFTQSLYPEPVTYNWPMNLEVEFSILKHSTFFKGNNADDLFKYYLDRSLYHLYIVINATNKKLVISFSKKYDGIEQSPAHYLHDIAKVFNIESSPENPKSIKELLLENNLLQYPTSKPKSSDAYYKKPSSFKKIPENSVISIEEVATYNYCPRRFYYEKHLPNQRVYTNVFHLTKYVEALLYEECVETIVSNFRTVSPENKIIILSKIDQVIEKLEINLRKIFALATRHWENIKFNTKFRIEKLLDNVLTNNPHHHTAHISLDGQKIRRKYGTYYFTGERRLRVTYPDVTHYYSISNFQELLSFRVNTNDKEVQNHLLQVKKHYQHLLREFCYGRDFADIKLNDYANKISQNNFEKNPGGHCQYCPFFEMCMEREIDE